MAMLTAAGAQTLASSNITTYTRVYVDEVLRADSSVNNLPGETPVIGYQINCSRKLGAAKLILTVANDQGKYSYHREFGSIFSHGNRIKVAEGLAVGGTIEWFTRFTGIIVSQVAANAGGKPSLKVYAMDNMKLLLNYLPDKLDCLPAARKVVGEVLTPVAGPDNQPYYSHYRTSANPSHTPWVDIPYPIFYKDGKRIKENYEIDLIGGEVYFGERMWTPTWEEAAKVTATQYSNPSTKPGVAPLIVRSYTRREFDASGKMTAYRSEKCELAGGANPVVAGAVINFAKDPFADLPNGPNWDIVDKKIYVSTETPNQVTADYWYYDKTTNLAEDVLRNLARAAGFKDNQILVETTARFGEPSVSLKPLRFNNLNIKNGFEILQKIKQQLPPNYIISCDREGNFSGKYIDRDLSQSGRVNYKLELIKSLEAPISEEGLYSVVVAHGVDLNPNDLGKTATATSLLNNPGVPGGINNALTVSGSTAALFNKNVDDQMCWQWRQMNNHTPPGFPFDLLTINLPQPKKVQEISLLIGDYKGGTIQQSLSVQISENGTDWFYVDQASRGAGGYSSQWVAVKGGELENREIRAIKITAEAGFEWTETHSYTEQGGWFLNPKVSVRTDTYYNWFLAIKEIQIWEDAKIAVTSALGNCIGIGDGVKRSFFIPNKPVADRSVTLFVEGVQVAAGNYAVNNETGEVTFNYPPTGILTANYKVQTKQPSATQATLTQRVVNNVTLLNPATVVEFTGGDLAPASPQFRLLKKIGLKKIALKPDNYLNSFADVQRRGRELLNELKRLQETMDVDVVYRPDIDIGHIVQINDSTLGINSSGYLVEEIIESKQGYTPSLQIRVSY